MRRSMVAPHLHLKPENDFRDAEAIAEAVQRPTMKFVVTKTADQLDLQALHRVRERLVSQRTGVINQIRAFLLERGIAVREGQRFLRVELPRILATPPDVLSPRMVRVIEGLASDWNRNQHQNGLDTGPLSQGRRLIGKAPWGHWKTTTFVAACAVMRSARPACWTGPWIGKAS